MHVLEHGRVRVELDPVRCLIGVRRDGRSVVADLRVWACAGEALDRFLRVTEGVVAAERRAAAERPRSLEVAESTPRRLVLNVELHGGRSGRLELAIPAPGHVLVQFEAAGDPLRLAAEWDPREGEAFAGLGARHHLRADHAGRAIQLGADRRYTGPSCPPGLSGHGGVPLGDYAPSPWLQSSAGYAVWCETDGNGTRFELRRPVRVSVRARSGPLRLHLLCAPSPAARLRAHLRATGLPALLPEWGYGFWKSRDVYPHQDDVEDDVDGCRRHGIPLDAVVLDSPWETQYNTWVPNPHQFRDFEEMVRRFRRDGVRTVVWVTPWVNLESRHGQMPPGEASRQLHAASASNYAEGRRSGYFARNGDGDTYVARWWMGTGSLVDFTSPAAETWWRTQARGALALGVEGIKADDGEGYYLPDDLRLTDGSTGAQSAWRYGGLYRASMQRALDEELGAGRGVLFGRPGWTGQQATGVVWAGDQPSDAWSLRALVAATVSAASSGYSNWSHDVGGYLGEGGLHRCAPELLVRWAQLGSCTPLMQAHGRLIQEPWTYDERTLELYRGYVLLHECLIPYVRAAAATAARCGLPIVRPASLLAPGDPRAWQVADAFGYGPSMWVAPVLDVGVRARRAWLPPGRWIETWSGEAVTGGREVEVEVPLERMPVWVRDGALIVTYPAEHVARGLGDTPEGERPLVATLWGAPPAGRALVRLADGTRVRWSERDGLRPDRPREIRLVRSG